MATSRARYEEHQFSKVIPGDIEAVRKRISEVIEDFGYTLLGSNPIQAKRRRQRNLFTATVLECQTQLMTHAIIVRLAEAQNGLHSQRRRTTHPRHSQEVSRQRGRSGCVR